MNPLLWYWHRLRAMRPAEVAAHLRRKWRQAADLRPRRDWAVAPLTAEGAFPRLPPPQAAPPELRAALAQASAEIRPWKSRLTGRWRAFGRLELRVDDPPRWHKDYLAGQDLATTQSAFKLDHRTLPGGADIKLIWELSRWYSLARLAQAAYVLDDRPAALKCLEWMEHWAAHNPPYRGWNWTSALEAGMRLVQLTWMDALLTPALEREGRLPAWEQLRNKLLLPHYRFVWRYRSFGSSANNHLLGELTGLVLAGVRWPALARQEPSLDRLQSLWEAEVLAQFAGDGGNREQALNYHLYAWEFCWQAKFALESVGRRVAPAVLDRLAAAARFFVEVQTDEPWDYGDSDDAFVSPLFVEDGGAVAEWRAWMGGQKSSPGLEYWLGASPATRSAGLQPALDVRGAGGPQPLEGHPKPAASRRSDPASQPQVSGCWRLFTESGIGTASAGQWWLRWDLSPLGYLSMASHGHADALHLSLWLNGVALIIDPGTGAYFPEPKLRAWLASRAAHNGPCPAGWKFPKRLAAFLWGESHPQPRVWPAEGEPPGETMVGELALPQGTLRRTVKRLDQQDGWRVIDELVPAGGFSVLWQFAPGSRIERLGERWFRISRRGAAIEMVVGAEWAEVQVHAEERPARAATELPGIVSPHFRQTTWAPFVKLLARDSKACLLPTTFLASEVQ